MTANNDALPDTLARMQQALRGKYFTAGSPQDIALDAAIRALSADRGEAVAWLITWNDGTKQVSFDQCHRDDGASQPLYAATPPSPAESAEGAYVSWDDASEAAKQAYRLGTAGTGYQSAIEWLHDRTTRITAAAPSGVSDAMVDAFRARYHGPEPVSPFVLSEIRAALEFAMSQPQPGRVEGMVLDAHQLRWAAEFAAPDYDHDESQRGTELVFQWMPERTVDGEVLPAGKYCWYAEYPEEGCIELEEYDEYTKRMTAAPTACAKESDHV